MTQRATRRGSALTTGLAHTGLGLFGLGSLGAAMAGVVHLTGNAEDAGPRVEVALFEPQDDTATPVLKARLRDGADPQLLTVAYADSPTEGETSVAEPSLGVPDLDGPVAQELIIPPPAERASGTVIRINGRPVPAGSSFGEVDAVTPEPPVALARAPIAGLQERSGGYSLPRIGDDGTLPADAYARPMTVSGDRPRVALVVGGLGINWRVTQQAIDDLPADVTLSFAPHAKDLQGWINKARADGHEVLIEVPMEPYDWGRNSPEPNTLSSSDGVAGLERDLLANLSKAQGYFGIMNYQGAKYATDPDAVAPLVADLKSRGLVMIEDGSLPRSVIPQLATEAGLGFSSADAVIDADTRATAIEAELARLESLALEEGAALGTGFAFPVTVDTVAVWAEQLEDKGISLVPASALVLPTIRKEVAEADETGADMAAADAPDPAP